MTINISFWNASFLIVCIGVIQFLFSIWIKSRLENSIKSEYDRFLEDYKFDLKAREQAAKVAEYIALYYENSDNFARMNQLSFELALWLPADIYKSLGKALKKEEGEKNIFQILIDIRKIILRNPGDLTDKNIIWHAEGAGRNRADNET